MTKSCHATPPGNMIPVMSDIAGLFASLSPHPVSFAAGSAVFRIGDPVRRVYLVHTGAIHLVRHHQNGAPLVLQRAGPGSILAEASVFSEHYHCDAVATAATDAVWMSRHVLRHRLATDGTFAQVWARHLGHEVQRARLQAEIMSLKTVSGRLDAWLALRGTLPPKGEWTALAAEIGVSPEALYREMAKRRR